ncbi:hypothetical protein [Streptomyces iranensis]|uniref:Uncharacterized protein n=1 Tax=Streptomyces iranensis TaxID=576784 RepID=A0A060ZNC3_9ACTN|nr:hypothetical protein [Streptomyces iranensis]MBP2062446.1 hypothetical protein [Streptomyces iranensis]CDR07346.1 predicted protein [Streptomyces iranensis]
MPDQRGARETATDDRFLGTFDVTLRGTDARLECRSTGAGSDRERGRGRERGQGRERGRGARRVSPRGVLRYRDVVSFLVRNRARAPEAAAGAVLRRRQGPVFVVQTFFLDQEGVPLADTEASAPVWVCRARRLDEELCAAFGDKDLIIFGEAGPSC